MGRSVIRAWLPDDSRGIEFLTARLFAAVGISAVLGIGLFVVVAVLGRVLVPWGRERGRQGIGDREGGSSRFPHPRPLSHTPPLRYSGGEGRKTGMRN